MSAKKITDLVAATSLNTGDKLLITQGSDSKQADFDLVMSNVYNTSKLWQNRNAIINGDMRIAQRGVSFVSPSNGSYTIDRWRYSKQSSTATHTISQDSDVPNNQFSYSMKIDCTATDTNVDYHLIDHRIEGYNFRKFVGQTATFSFWIKSSKTGTMCITFRNTNGNISYISEVTIDQANTWEKKSVTLDFDYSGGTWDYTNGVGLQVCFNLFFGATYQTSTTDSWVSGNYLGTANQTNFLDSTSNVIYITGVQLELGDEATDYEFLDITNQLAQCQRYYCKCFSSDKLSGGYTYERQYTVNPTITMYFPTTMRTTPVLTTYALDGSAGYIRAGGANYAATLIGVDESHGNVYVSSSLSQAQYEVATRWDADAEL